MNVGNFVHAMLPEHHVPLLEEEHTDGDMGRPEEGLRREPSGLSFVFDEPAILFGDALAIADLHLGIETSFHRNGVFVPSMAKSLEARLRALIEECCAKKLIVVGDVKDSIAISRQEEREIPKFFSSLDGIETHIVKGNHDGTLGKILPENVVVHPSEGFLLNDIYFSHGNAWPGAEFAGARYLVMGHLHPAIEFRDNLGARNIERCWLRCTLDRKRLKERYPKANAKEAIVIPPFNKLAGAMPLQSLKPESPLLRSGIMDPMDGDVYLLDGVHLGKLKELSFINPLRR